MPQTYGLTHLAIAVSDIKKTLSFYTHVFGMQVMYEEEKMIQLTTPGAHDIIVFEEKPGAVTPDTGGIAHFGFRLRHPDDIKYFRERIRETGNEVIDSGEFVPGSPFIFFRDPDGYTIEIWYEIDPIIRGGPEVSH